MKVTLKTLITITITLLSTLGALYVTILYTDIIKHDVYEKSQNRIRDTVDADKATLINFIKIGAYLNLNQHLKNHYGKTPEIEGIEILIDNDSIAVYRKHSELTFSTFKTLKIPLIEQGEKWGELKVLVNQTMIDERISGQIRSLYLSGGIILLTVVIVAIIISSLVSREVVKIFRVIDYSHNKIKQASNLYDLEESLRERPTIKSFLSEISTLTKVFDDFLNLIKDANTRLNKLENDIHLAQQAQQIAHDIRSPLDVLRGLKQDIQELPKDSRMRMEMSISRIEEIAHNLLKTHQTSMLSEALVPMDLVSTMNVILREKEQEFGQNDNLTLRLSPTAPSQYVSKIHVSAFKRVMSNLINNSFEALPNGHGTITTELSQEENFNVIRIKDSGNGIPPELQANLFSRGFTSKPDGNGLGLYGAHDELHSIRGTIELESSSRNGTTFKISIPIHCPPSSVILIDDTKLFRLDWDSYCNSKNIRFKSFDSVDSFLADSNFIAKDSFIYIDSDLGQGIKGEVESQRIFELGYENLFLATGLTPNDINKPHWIKAVYSKNPRNIF